MKVQKRFSISESREVDYTFGRVFTFPGEFQGDSMIAHNFNARLINSSRRRCIASFLPRPARRFSRIKAAGAGEGAGAGAGAGAGEAALKSQSGLRGQGVGLDLESKYDAASEKLDWLGISN